MTKMQLFYLVCAFITASVSVLAFFMGEYIASVAASVATTLMAYEVYELRR